MAFKIVLRPIKRKFQSKLISIKKKESFDAYTQYIGQVYALKTYMLKN